MLEFIKNVPSAFVDAFSKINEAIKLLSAIDNLEVGQGLSLIKGETKWLLTLDAETNDGTASPGGGLPDGYAEETFTICEDGDPVDIYILVRRSA